MTEQPGADERNFYDRERSLDWLTGLFPIWLIALCYYRWAAVWPILPAVAGYLLVCHLFRLASRPADGVFSALISGLLVTFCLPAGVPLWMTAIAGLVAGLVAALPVLISRRFAQSPLALPLLQPALVGVVLVWLAFPKMVGSFSIPAQWLTADGVTAATSLAGLTDKAQGIPLMRLFFGVYPGARGQTCSPVLLLAGLYLGLRRRLRLIAPACMLGTVAVLSWIIWGRPLYGVLCGGVLLAALLLADRTVAPAHYGVQAATGCLAGIIGILLRLYTHTDGMAVGVLVACALAPLTAWLGRQLYRFGRWGWPKIRPLAEKIREIFAKCKIFEKIKKNS